MTELRTFGLFGLVGAGLAAVWVPLVPLYAPHFDTINFALAVEDFEPLLHQPQPPGYPLVVLTTRLLRPLLYDPHVALFGAGVLAGTLAAYFLWRLALEMFGARAALFAVVLLVFHPVFWLAGIRAQARLFLATGAAAVAWLAWRAINDRGRRRYLTLALATLGLAAGFRPELLLMISPMLVVTARYIRLTIREVFTAAGLGAAVTTAWLAPLAGSFGGWSHFVYVLEHYVQEQFGGSSLLFGAPSRAALQMMLTALVWTGLGGFCWIWDLPRALGTADRRPCRAAWLLLAWWALPPLAWHCLIHAGDPEHTLVSVPVLCLAGGWVLAHGRPQAVRSAVATSAVAGGLGLLMFFGSVPSPDAGYAAVRRAAGDLAGVMEALAELGKERPLFLISCEHAGVWRQVSYYFPQHRLLVLHGTPEHPGHPARHMFYHNRRRLPPPVQGDNIILIPQGCRLLFLLPDEKRLPQWIEGPLRPARQGALHYLDLPVQAGLQFQVGAYRLVVEPAPVERTPCTPYAPSDS